MNKCIFDSIKNSDISSVIAIANEMSNDELKERSSDFGLSPINFAAKNKKYDAVEILIDKMDNLDMERFYNEHSLLDTLLIDCQNGLADKVIDKMNSFFDPNKDPSNANHSLALAINARNVYVAEQIIENSNGLDLGNVTTSYIYKDGRDESIAIKPPLESAIFYSLKDLAKKIVDKSIKTIKIKNRAKLVNLAKNLGMDDLAEIISTRKTISRKEAEFLKTAKSMVSLKKYNGYVVNITVLEPLNRKAFKLGKRS